MSSAKTLIDAEVALIRGMAAIKPRMTNQAILAYFTRPGRDINHRAIAQIAQGWGWPNVAAASPIATAAFMRSAAAAPRPNAGLFVPSNVASTQAAVPSVFQFTLDWWPVGQGLFSSGAVIRRDAPPLSWVFDCGTASSESLLTAAIDRHNTIQDSMGASGINLAALSHFDNDHIIGFSKLAQNEIIEIALLPYIPLWQRIIIAIEQDIDASSAIFDFFVDPAGYLLGIGEGRVQKVVFVQSTGPDDAPPGPPEAPGEGPIDTGRDDLKVENGKPPADALDDQGASTGQDTRVSFLRKSGRIIAPHFWEFLPYNDAQMLPNVSKGFINSVLPEIQSLCTNPANRKASLDKIKGIYDATFGSTAFKRNVISLFLYSGPIGKVVTLENMLTSHRTLLEPGTCRFSQMLTGDGYLNKSARFDQFLKFFNPGNRLKNSGIFQVMHHGSRDNWHADIADKLSPLASLFCSDPHHKGYKHPHPDVLRDFWPYAGIQIDRTSGFHIFGHFSIY